MDDWRGTVAFMAESLGIRWPRGSDEIGSAIDAFLRPELDHYVPTSENRDTRPGRLGWTLDVYKAISHMLRNGPSASAANKLDRVRSEFDRGAAIFGAAIFPELKARDLRLAELNEERLRQVGRADEANRRAAGAESALEGMFASRSWRLTRPLRGVTRLASRISGRSSLRHT